MTSDKDDVLIRIGFNLRLLVFPLGRQLRPRKSVFHEDEGQSIPPFASTPSAEVGLVEQRSQDHSFPVPHVEVGQSVDRFLEYYKRRNF